MLRQGEAAAVGVAANARAVQRLRKECEKAKRILSAASQAFIEVEAFSGGDEDLRVTLTRAKLEEVCAPLWARLMAPVEAAVSAAAGVAVRHVVLVGGSTRTPKVRQLLAARFPGIPITSQGIHPDEAVACGAALQAASLTRACAAPVLLLDVTPITLGVETAGGVRTAVLPRNSTIPCRVKHRFSTYQDRQPSARIRVLEGERPVASECHQLGVFELGPLPPLPKGQACIEVMFHVNADGILDVTATETSSKTTQQLQVTRWNIHHKDAKQKSQKALAQAQTHFDKDAAWTQRIRAQHQLEQAIFDVAQRVQTPAFRRTHARDACDDIHKACQEAQAWLASATTQKQQQARGGAVSVDQMRRKKDELEGMLAAAPPAPPPPQH